MAGTERHSYFHCLHYQNTRNTGALAEALAAWSERDPQPNERRSEIELREALLTRSSGGASPIMHEEFGAEVREVDPPIGRPQRQREQAEPVERTAPPAGWGSEHRLAPPAGEDPFDDL